MPRSQSEFVKAAATSNDGSELTQTRLNKPLEAPRFACAFAGAYAAANNITRSIPVAHAGAGCVFQQVVGTNFGGGYQGVGYVGGNAAPSCNLSENEVVFGGEGRLREQLQATLELMDGDFYSVLGGCIPAMIGDDVESVVKEISKGSGAPILYVDAAGFKGTSHYGYEQFLKAAITQILEKPDAKTKGLVNVLGVIPILNPYWKGIFKEIRRLFNRLGLEANLVFGHEGGGLEGLQRLSSAELTLVLSPWVGVESARLLHDAFEVPYTVYPAIPVGPASTSEVVRQVGKALQLEERLVEAVIAEEEKESYYFLDLAGDSVGMFSPSLSFAIVADSGTAIGLTRFLVNEAGLYPIVAIVTDNPPEAIRPLIEERLSELAYGLKPAIVYEEDSYRIHEALDDYSFGALFASSIEKYYSGKEHAFHLSVSFPANDRLLFDRAYAGYGGGGNLLEDLFAKFIMPF